MVPEEVCECSEVDEMFEMTREQQEAWRRKVHSVDAALKSAIEPQETAPRPVRRLHLVPALHVPSFTQERKTAAA